MTEFFYALTPDWILKAVEEGGLRPTGHCLQLGSLENRVYDLRLEDDRHVVVKFYRPGRWSRETILEEHRFLLSLKEAEIPVCAPLAFADGQTLHEVQDILYAVWPRTGGRSPDEITDAEAAILGRALGRIHRIGGSLKAVHRPVLNADRYAIQPALFLSENGFLPDACRDQYVEAASEIAGIYTELSHNVTVSLIHGDCHKGNLLNGNEGWFFLDFDDCLIGPAVQDFWMILPPESESPQTWEIFLNAYEQFHAFDRSTLRLIEPLRALRFIHYAYWVARRWDDPAFPDAFPDFGTPSYWEEETRDLEDALLRIRTGTAGLPAHLRGGPVEEERELTNKDFFWDMQD